MRGEGLSGSSARCPSSFTNPQVKKPALVEGCWEDTSEFLAVFSPWLFVLRISTTAFYYFTIGDFEGRTTKEIWLKYLGYLQRSHLQCCSALLSHLSQIATVFTDHRCCPKSEESPDVHLCWDLQRTCFWVSQYIFCQLCFPCILVCAPAGPSAPCTEKQTLPAHYIIYKAEMLSDLTQVGRDSAFK